MTSPDFDGDRIPRFPVAEGLIEAAAVAGGMLLALGAGQHAVAGSLAPFLAWGIVAFRRPLAFQLVAALILGIVGDAASARFPGASLLPMGCALIVANGADPLTAGRWQPGHAVFALIAAVCGWGAFVVAGHFAPAWFGEAPGVGALAGGLLWLAIASVVVACWRLVRHWRRTRRGGPTLGRRIA